MSKKDIIDYVMETPGNTNKKVLGRLIDEVEGGGGTGLFVVEEVIDDENENIHKLDKTFGEIVDAYLSGNHVAKLSSGELQDVYDNVIEIVVTKTGAGSVVFYSFGSGRILYGASNRDEYPYYDLDD